MKQTLFAIVAAAALFMPGCSTFQNQVTNETTTLATQLMHYVPAIAQPAVANYVDYCATQLRLIDTTQSAQQIVDKVLLYIPASVREKYPFIVSIVSRAVTDAFSKYGQVGLDDIADGLEAAMAPFIRV